jgi:hypothetical protein
MERLREAVGIVAGGDDRVRPKSAVRRAGADASVGGSRLG